MRVWLVSAMCGKKMTVRTTSNPIFIGAGVFDPKNGASATTGAMRISPKKNRESAAIGALSVSLEKKER